jgi:hypothetical protein
MGISNRGFWNLKEIEIPNRGKMHFHMAQHASVLAQPTYLAVGLHPKKTRTSDPGLGGD